MFGPALADRADALETGAPESARERWTASQGSSLAPPGADALTATGARSFGRVQARIRDKASSTPSAPTAASASPAASAPVAVCDPAGRGRPAIASATRGPANPIVAPSTTSVTWARLPNEANTPPVVGWPNTATWSRPARACARCATTTAGICTSDAIPSCIRLPPVAVTRMTGNRPRVARSKPSATVAPVTEPTDPPRNPKSHRMAMTSTPPTTSTSQVTASGCPVRCRAAAS